MCDDSVLEYPVYSHTAVLHMSAIFECMVVIERGGKFCRGEDVLEDVSERYNKIGYPPPWISG